jgi:eukaryotic-like serine/threonine-protein kinase
VRWIRQCVTSRKKHQRGGRYAALREAEFGNTADAKQGVEAALALAPGRDVKLTAALTLARIGETAGAKAIVEELEKNYPSFTVLKVYWLPSIKAAMQLNANNSTQAVTRSCCTPRTGCCGAVSRLCARRSLSSRASGQRSRRRIPENPRPSWDCAERSHRPLAHLGRARAYALSGDTAKAKTAYNDFFTLRKDADPDIPILVAAKSEYAKLQ